MMYHSEDAIKSRNDIMSLSATLEKFEFSKARYFKRRKIDWLKINNLYLEDDYVELNV